MDESVREYFCFCQNGPNKNSGVRRLLGCLFFCFLSISHLHSVVWAEKIPEQKETLVGIKDVVVSVNIGLSKTGPTHNNLQDLVVKIIKDAGMNVLPKEDSSEGSSIPSLYIDVAVAKGKNNFHTFFVTTMFYQTVELQQGKQVINPLAATWVFSTIGVGGLESIQEEVVEASEKFARDYQSVN